MRRLAKGNLDTSKSEILKNNLPERAPQEKDSDRRMCKHIRTDEQAFHDFLRG